jgi:DNA-binding SARP family transcriptional activator
MAHPGECSLEFRVLGPVRASVNGANVPLGGSKQRTVLAALLLNGGRVLGDDRLTQLLWDGSPPATVNAQVHSYISRLRMRLSPGATIERKYHGYVFRAQTAWFDHAEFESLTAGARSELANGHYEAAAGQLRRALALWHGRALSGVTAVLEYAGRPGLEEARMTALETRIDVDLLLGRHSGLVAELTELVSEFPFRERLRAALMIALYRCDRQADALAVYQSGRRVLAEEFGIDPGETLACVHHAVLTGDFSRTPVSAPVRQYPRQPLPASASTAGRTYRKCIELASSVGCAGTIHGSRDVRRPE